MALTVLAAGLEQILTRFSRDDVGQCRGERLPIRAQTGSGRHFAFPDHVELGLAFKFCCIARRREAVRLPGSAFQDRSMRAVSQLW